MRKLFYWMDSIVFMLNLPVHFAGRGREKSLLHQLVQLSG